MIDGVRKLGAKELLPGKEGLNNYRYLEVEGRLVKIRHKFGIVPWNMEPQEVVELSSHDVKYTTGFLSGKYT